MSAETYQLASLDDIGINFKANWFFPALLYAVLALTLIKGVSMPQSKITRSISSKRLHKKVFFSSDTMRCAAIIELGMGTFITVFTPNLV